MYQRLDDIRDTFEACDQKAMRTIWYLKGEWTPHYPVPAIPYPQDLMPWDWRTD